MLPKFLLADNSQESLGRLYVVHTEEPRFILEGSDEDFAEDQTIHWLDKPNLSDDQIDDLMMDAERFVDVELENQENLYDEMEE